MKSKSQSIWFTPDVEISSQLSLNKVAIKGCKPEYYYPFELKKIYPLVPSLNAKDAYGLLKKELSQVNAILHDKLHLRGKLTLPAVSSDQEARTILSVMFDPNTCITDGLERQLSSARIQLQSTLFRLDNIYPFPLKLASPQKLAHTLVWIDTNIKLKLEGIGNRLNTLKPFVVQIVEAALKIYCLLVKTDDYAMANSINFNYSMFLQDKIVNLIVGDGIYNSIDHSETRGRLSNNIVLELLKSVGQLSYNQLCTMSTFMGVIWTSSEDLQSEYMSRPELTLTKIDSQLKSKQNNWCINQTDEFISDISSNERCDIAVILDDNGESVIDMALFQQLLTDFPLIKVKFIVNRFPVSNNISLTVFQSLLEDEFFMPLKQFYHEGRVQILLEEQLFRSFEIDCLKPETKMAVNNSRLTYIKGVNFFETFQNSSIVRYHCFTVHGPTSILLTGCCGGNGVFVKLQPGQSAFKYHSFDNVETLKETIHRTHYDE